MNTRYIIALFIHSIPFTYQWDRKLHWNFQSPFIAYKNLACAEKKARKLCAEYKNELTCIFKVELGEDVSRVDLKNWRTDKERLVFSLEPN